MSLASVLSALALRETYDAGLPLAVAVLFGLFAAVLGGRDGWVFQWCDYRQTEGAAVHCDPGYVIHRARRGAADVGKHDRDRAAPRGAQLWQ